MSDTRFVFLVISAIDLTFFLQPFTNDFPRADIHELLSPDLLHQLIKGTFKDHLVAWVESYLISTHGQARAKEVMDDIDKRISVAAPFAGLRRFPVGRGFKQWTGDDSKALMKVYLPAIEGHVPRNMVRTFRAFMEFCYIARSNVHDTATLAALSDALARFHQYRTIFQECGVRPDGFSLPRQHSLMHYESSIRAFGAPNGLCSSITESKHIKAVKEPWRRSSRFNALGQMLLTNQRLDKLAASRVDFNDRGMLKGTVLSDAVEALRSVNEANDLEVAPLHAQGIGDEDDDDDDGGVVAGPTILASVDLAKTILRKQSGDELAAELGQPNFVMLLRQFLHLQLQGDTESLISANDLPDNIPHFNERISVYSSAVATFYAPSDLSGVGGMHREHIRAVKSWRRGPPRYDCIFVSTDENAEGMRALDVARVRLFFSFTYSNVFYPCALVQWFSRVGDEPDEDTGMWMVEPDLNDDGSPHVAVIHLDAVMRAAHLLGVYGDVFLPKEMSFSNSLDAFYMFYVNKFIDHHTFQIAF